MVTVAALTWVPVDGRKLIDWAPLVAHWTLRVLTKQLTYRRRLTKPRRAGVLTLPGDTAALRHYEDPETGAAMVHDPRAATLTVVLQVDPPSFVLLDQAEQQRRVAGWSRVLATVCRSGRIARLQVLERTLPDAGTGLAQWWNQHGIDDGSWLARTYRELIDRSGPVGERHVTTLSLALDMKAAGRAIRSAGGGMRGAAHVLRQEMTTLTTALRSADPAVSGWYPPPTSPSPCALHDPAVSGVLERSSEIGRDLATAGPVAVEETWDGLRSDSARHAVLWICEWPRSLVSPGFLHPVVLTSGVRRYVSLLCDPVRTDLAARDTLWRCCSRSTPSASTATTSSTVPGSRPPWSAATRRENLGAYLARTPVESRPEP